MIEKIFGRENFLFLAVVFFSFSVFVFIGGVLAEFGPLANVGPIKWAEDTYGGMSLPRDKGVLPSLSLIFVWLIMGGILFWLSKFEVRWHDMKWSGKPEKSGVLINFPRFQDSEGFDFAPRENEKDREKNYS